MLSAMKTVTPAAVDVDRARLGFAGSLGAVCLLFVLLLLVCTEYPAEAVSPAVVQQFYLYLNHVLVMIFVGFGMLMTFLRRYSMSAVGLNFFASAMVYIEAIVCVGACQQVFWGAQQSVVTVDLPLLIDAAFCAGSAMIAFGAVIGKATPTQLLWLLFIQVPFYALNQHLVAHVFKALDMGGTIVIHAFGCYYGLAASAALSRNQRGYGVNHAKNGSNYVSDILSMIGTLFLWINWPSFNGALASIIPAGEEDNVAQASAQFLAISNTLVSLLGSTLATFAVSGALDGKLSAVAVQNATLAGGVAMGAACTLKMSPGVAFVIGLFAGIVSTLGFKFLTTALDRRFGLGDTCGIHNLHGMPAIIGGLVAGLIAFSADASYLPHTPSTQLAYQAAAVFSAVAVGIASGYAAGWLVSTVNVLGVPTQTAEQVFEDAVWWSGSQLASAEALTAAASPVKALGPVLQRNADKEDATTVSRGHSMDELIAPSSAC